MLTYQNVILFSWAAFIVVWAISSFNIKRDIRGGFSSVWQQYWLLRVVAAVLLIFVLIRYVTGRAHVVAPTKPIIFHSFFFPPLALGWFAAALSVIGIATAIWARIHLGRNWSPRPAIKEQHELVTSGPYAYVRHPIYTGMLLAALGTLLTGTVFGVIVLAIATLVFLTRIPKEEKLMLELFPAQYPIYRSRTKRLIPFIW